MFSFSEHHHFRTIPEQGQLLLKQLHCAPAEQLHTKHEHQLSHRPCHWRQYDLPSPSTRTFQENTDLALIDSQYPMQGQRAAELAPQGAEQAATSHQVKPTMKGEGRAWSAQALFPQLVSVIFHILAQSQNATTVQLGRAHPRH